MSLRSTLSRVWPHRTDDNADRGEVAQDAKELTARELRTKRLQRSLGVRRGNLAFSGRAIARHLGISEKIVRMLLSGERPVADHHVAALPETIRLEVVHGRPSERTVAAPALGASGIRRKP